MRAERMHRRRAAPAALLLAALPAFGNAEAPGALLEETLVTAQHREESALSTPVSLVTFDREQLVKQRITSIDNLNGLVPNLNIDSFPANSQTLRLFIRGVGLTDTQVTQDSAVGVYLNGAYIARSTGLALDLADLERIEVLRGPQGTLYGRNTTAGALKLITRKPDTQGFEFAQTFSAGSQDLFGSQTSLNLPIAGRYAARAALFYEDVEGFTGNDGPGGSWGDRESTGFRLDLRGELTDNLTVDYGFDWSDIERYNLAVQAVTPRESGGDLLAVIGDIVRDYVPYDNNRISTLSTTVPLLPTETSIQGHTLNIDWAVSDGVALRSITAWRELSDESYLDFAGGSGEGFRLDFNGAVVGADAGDARRELPVGRPDLDQEQFSQEIQLLGSVGEQLDYIAGLYYFHEQAEEDARPERHIFSVFPFGADGTVVNLGSEYNEIENDAWAFFTQATWTPDILDQRLHLTAGWRHSRDSRDAVRRVDDEVVVDTGSTVLPLLTLSSFSTETGDDFDDNSFTFIAEFDWSQSVNAYAKYAEAYRSGGYNIRDPQEQDFSEGFDEEKLWTVEAGLKGRLPSRRLSFSGAVFYQEYDDFQYNFPIPGTLQGTRVFNIDEGQMSGVELEVTAMPTAALFLQARYAYLDSELDDVANPISGELQSFNFTNAPEHTWSVLTDYTFEPLGVGILNINATYSFVDDRLGVSDNGFRPDYTLVNAQVSLSGLEGLGGGWRIALWGRNLQDSDYEAFALDNLPQADRAVIWGDGLSYGLDVTYRFR